MKKLEDVTEYITPKEVAKKLNIAPETLRKYAILVDKINKENFFCRDSNNARMYSRSDVTLLERFVKTKSNAGITIKEAMEQVFKELHNSSITPTVLTEQNGENEYLMTIIKDQNETIKRYESLANDLIENNNKLIKKMEVLIVEKNTSEINKDEEKKIPIGSKIRKKGFLSLFFNK